MMTVDEYFDSLARAYQDGLDAAPPTLDRSRVAEELRKDLVKKAEREIVYSVSFDALFSDAVSRLGSSGGDGE